MGSGRGTIKAMKTLLFFAIFTICFACSNSADFVSQHGVRLFYQKGANRWDEAQVNNQELYFLDKLKKAGIYLEADKALAEAAAYIYPDKIACGSSSPTGYCNGLQDYSSVHVRDMGCPYNSAYTHELAHWVQQAAGVSDYSHTESMLWNIANSAPEKCP